MNRIVRFVVLPLAVVVVVAIGLASYIAATFDPNDYKPQIVQAVKDKTQRTLTLDGDIRLSFWPDIGARLGKVSLSERGGGGEFAGMDDFRASLKLMPLLSKQAIVDSVEIRNLRANLVRHEDGHTNFDDLAALVPASDAGGASGVSIAIERVVIANAAITLIDRRAGVSYQLSKLDFESGRIASGVPVRMAASFNARSDKPAINLDAAVRTTLTFDLERRRHALDGLSVNAKGLAAGIADLVAHAQGSVAVGPAEGEFAVSGLVIAATGKRDAIDLNVRLEMPTLRLDAERIRAENIAFDLRLREGRSRTVAKLDIPAIEGGADAVGSDEVMASLEAHYDGTAVRAKLTAALTASGDGRHLDLGKLKATVNVNSPELLKSPVAAAVTGSAQVDLARSQASLTFATRVDDSNIKGKAGLAAFSPPFYTFDIDIDQLDADRYLVKSDPARKPQQPFDLATLKKLNASGSLRIGTLTRAGVKASGVRLDVKGEHAKTGVQPAAGAK